MDRLYSDLQLTLTTMCLCPQKVCEHCAHSHKPEIPNPDIRDITTAALSVVCLSAYFSSFFHFFMSSFSLAFPSKHHLVAITSNSDIRLRVFVSHFVHLLHFPCHICSKCIQCAHCRDPGPSSTSAAVFPVLFEQVCTERCIQLLNSFRCQL